MTKNKQSGGAAEQRKQVTSGRRCLKKYGPALDILESSVDFVRQDLAFNCLGTELARCRFIDMDVDRDGHHLLIACELTWIGAPLLPHRLEVAWHETGIKTNFSLDQVDLEVNIDTGEIRAYVRLSDDEIYTLYLGFRSSVWESSINAL